MQKASPYSLEGPGSHSGCPSEFRVGGYRAQPHISTFVSPPEPLWRALGGMVGGLTNVIICRGRLRESLSLFSRSPHPFLKSDHPILYICGQADMALRAVEGRSGWPKRLSKPFAASEICPGVHWEADCPGRKITKCGAGPYRPETRTDCRGGRATKGSRCRSKIGRAHV